jgi:hypothetical protein
MNKIIILMCMLNGFVFGTDINSLIEELKNNDENEEVLYKILEHLPQIYPVFIESAEEIYKNPKNKLPKEFRLAFEAFIAAKNNNNIFPACSYEGITMNNVFFFKENILEEASLKYKNFIRLNQSAINYVEFKGRTLSIQKINFRRRNNRNTENKNIMLPKEKFFIFEFNENEKYILAMPICLNNTDFIPY